VDRLRQRLSVAGQAAATLRELAVRPAPSKIERDAAIQRFEYSFEATWKAAQRFLAVVEGVEAGSPKSAIRACHEAGGRRRKPAHSLEVLDTSTLPRG
jgi:hypothetical protein